MSVVDAIKHYQRSLEKCSNDTTRILHCIYKLYKLPITVQHLQETGVGRTVNSLRKYDGDTGEAAKALVNKWKSMVMDEDSCGENEDKSPDQSSDDSSHHKRVDEKRKEKSSNQHKKEHKRKAEENSYSHKKKKIKDKIKVEKEESSEQEEEDNCVKSGSSRQVDENVKNQRIKEEIDDEMRRVAEEEYETEDPGMEDSGGEENASRLHIAESENEDSDVPHAEETTATKEVDSGSRKRSSKGESSDHHRSKFSSDGHFGSSKKHKDKHKEKHKDKNREKEKRSNPEKSRHEFDSKNSDKQVAADTKVKDPCPSDEKKKLKYDGSSSSKEVESKSVSTVNSKTHSKDEVNSKLKKSKRDKDSSKKKNKKAVVDKTADGSIDCFSGASFAEALGMVDPMPVLKKSRVSSPSVRQDKATAKKSVSSSVEVNSASSKPQSSSSKSSPILKGVDLLSPSTKLEPLEMDVDVDSDVDVNSTLPEINPNYCPLPHIPVNSPLHKKGRLMTEEEALSQVMSTKNLRTKVYSGLKSSKGMLKVPTLLELCIHVLIDNIDAMEYTGGVPYDLLEPVLKHATPQQLFTFEHYNPYLIGDTDELWTFHVNKEFRNKQPLEYESSRDMYIRCVEEREEKLKALTSNIQQSIAKSTPVRQTKLAYVDSVAKPPRSIARKQAKYGTASSTAVKISSPVKPPRLAGFHAAPSAGTSTAPVPVPPPAPVRVPVAKIKPRVAPLMQKTMKLVKSLKR